ncbi:hypothetical protein JHK82_050257 [Glycine max]|nr:hypothetical protein JHK82_050257 [Glycine max]
MRANIMVPHYYIVSKKSKNTILSLFASLLASATPIAANLSDRSSLSILVVPNAYLVVDDHLSPVTLADVLRYHVLLQFLYWFDLRTLLPSGKLITMLLQPIDRATNNFGSMNLTRDSLFGVILIRSPTLYSPSNTTIISLIKKHDDAAIDHAELSSRR